MVHKIKVGILFEYVSTIRINQTFIEKKQINGFHENSRKIKNEVFIPYMSDIHIRIRLIRDQFLKQHPRQEN